MPRDGFHAPDRHRTRAETRFGLGLGSCGDGEVSQDNIYSIIRSADDLFEGLMKAEMSVPDG